MVEFINIDSILSGSLKIIKQSEEGYYLDSNGNIILSGIIKGRWDISREIVPSDYGIKANN